MPHHLIIVDPEHPLWDEFIIDLKYASHDNFTGFPVNGYHANKLYLSKAALQALLAANREFKTYGFQIKILDAYRPQMAVNDFLNWRTKPENDALKQRFYPKFTKEELFQHKFIVSPSSHTRGSTVDITLVDESLAELDLGCEFDFFDEIAATNSCAVSPTAQKNRQLLCQTMTKHGFRNLVNEWWHYTLANEPYPQTYFDFPII